MRPSAPRGWLLTALCLVLAPIWAAPAAPLSADMDGYIAPYVAGNNFSGVVLVSRKGEVIFQKAYGQAVIGHSVPNTPETRFHVASLSMQFTAAAVMRLVEADKFSLDTPIGKLLPGVDHGDAITVRELLTETSGLTDINGLPDYDEMLLHHQTPASLVAKISGKPLLFTPGSQYLHEEHSAYNLLALLVEKTSGLDFATALQNLVFLPLGMRDCGADDSSGNIIPRLAEGYAPEGVRGLARAPYLDWSAKTGNGSVYCSAGDEVRWVDALLHDRLLSARARKVILAESKSHVGYGWFVKPSKRFGVLAYYMNGRSPGYSSYLLHVPSQGLTVVILSNIYSSVTTEIGENLAAIAIGKPHEPATNPIGLDKETLSGLRGSFRFGADFYQPGLLVLEVEDGDLFLRWPDGRLSPLIPVGQDRFIDRAYWEDVRLVRDTQGKITRLDYDRFQSQGRTDD